MKKNIPALTGIRGIAALLVVFYHLLHHSINFNLIKNGYLSVDLFFILSGFIMMYVHSNDFNQKIISKNYFSFMISRVKRIWPAYFCWVFFNLLLSIHHNNTPELFDLITNTLMIQSWFLSKSTIGTGWSLSVEFFCIFPFSFYMPEYIKKKVYNNSIKYFFFYASDCYLFQ
ncbi:acyltransferase [Tatumella sp. TA1]|nr:acyltransferase [Tatumella sp. TA1]